MCLPKQLAHHTAVRGVLTSRHEQKTLRCLKPGRASHPSLGPSKQSKQSEACACTPSFIAKQQNDCRFIVLCATGAVIVSPNPTRRRSAPSTRLEARFRRAMPPRHAALAALIAACALAGTSAARLPALSSIRAREDTVGYTEAHAPRLDGAFVSLGMGAKLDQPGWDAEAAASAAAGLKHWGLRAALVATQDVSTACPVGTYKVATKTLERVGVTRNFGTHF